MYSPDVVGGDVEAPGLPVDVGEALAGQADRGGVDDGSHLLHVFAQQAEKKRLVAILKSHQVEIAVEVVGLPLVALVYTLQLLFDGGDGRRQ